MEIFSYVVYGLAVFITLGWCLNIRTKARNEQTTEKSMELQGFLMTISLILIPLLHLSPFHLIWMIPTSFILGLLSITTPLKFLWIFSSLYFAFWYIGINNLGRKYYINGEYEKAIEAFKKEINDKPSSAEAYYNLGLAYGKIGQHEKEIDCYEESIKHNPNKPEIHFNLGIVHNKIGNHKEAIKALNESIKLRPNYLKAHYNICIIYAETGNQEKAMKELEIVKSYDVALAEELALLIRK